MSRHVYPKGEPECVICGAFGPTEDDQDCLAYIGPIDLGALVRHAMDVAAHVERTEIAERFERVGLTGGADDIAEEIRERCISQGCDCARAVLAREQRATQDRDPS